MLRRDFIGMAALAPLASAAPMFDIAALEGPRVLKAADSYLREKPITVTASPSGRSGGGPHDFFSEGDYWWPDQKNPDGPYIQRDGMTNPDNFVEHRRAMVRLSVQVPALTAAWLITGQRKYADHAKAHLKAWFSDEETRMNPNLQYAQAIKGRSTGRGIGIIDTIHLVEVARAAQHLGADAGVKLWFAEYANWMMTHPNGKEERDAKNNHGTCFAMQVASFAHLTGDAKLLDWARDRYRTVILPGQMGRDGSFPLELKRTKPYGYSLFNLDAMATLAETASTPDDNLWTFELADGRGMRKAVAYMEPFIRDRTKWTLPPDVMYDKEWPMRHCALLFAGLALGRSEYVGTWKRLRADSEVEEVIRNFFIRQPVLWAGSKGRLT